MSIPMKRWLIVTDDYDLFTTDDDAEAREAAQWMYVYDTTTGAYMDIDFTIREDLGIHAWVNDSEKEEREAQEGDDPNS